ncbi:MAG: N-terminal methylation motif protein [Cyanobacteria bacterium RYN_339]|nr:N-terminal methylation motif protein [Cyanobacteria bacterium RYN_339]
MCIGFTCNSGHIERLFAVCVLGIVASIALPSFVGAQDKARNVQVVSNLTTIELGLQRYAADHDGALPQKDGRLDLIASLTGPGGYMPEGRMPRSPWGTFAQDHIIPAVRVPTLEPLGRLHGAAEPASAEGTMLGDGLVPERIGGEAVDARKYGAVSYDHAGTRYVLYGTGKRGKTARIVGVRAGAAPPATPKGTK